MNASSLEVVEFFSQFTGVDYRDKPESAINKIMAYFRSHEIPESNLSLHYIRQDSALFEQIINLLTVNETYFYREVKQLEILYGLVKERPGVSILNAPCSSGEEAYSILLYFLSKQRDIKEISITGIDINTKVIAQAKEGIYNSRKVANVPAELLSGEFEIRESLYSIKSAFKQQCTFKAVNIFESTFDALGTFDVVFSRNMLIYFDPEMRKKAAQKLYARIKPGGLLFLGHADILEDKSNLHYHSQNGIVWYQKPN